MKHYYQPIFSFLVIVALASCTATPNGRLKAGKSYLATSKTVNVHPTEQEQKQEENEQSQDQNRDFTYLPSLTNKQDIQKNNENLTLQFSDAEMVSITADNLAVKDYLHYVFGELFKVSYILGEQVNAGAEKITLNMQEKISKRKLFSLSEQLLAERGIIIRFDDGIFYIHKTDNNTAGNFAYGYGNQVTDVPNTSDEIIQLAPFSNGMQTSLANTIKQLTKVDVQPMFEQNAIMIKGKRGQIIKALEFMQLMDQPGFKNRAVGLYRSTYTSVEELSEKLLELLKQEGISASIAQTNEKAVSIVLLDRINALVFFTNNKALLSRVSFWLSELDKPAEGSAQQYFIYAPQFARAVDLGESLQALLGQGTSPVSSSTSAANQNAQINTNAAPASNAKAGNVAVNADGMRMVVDERSNAIIFYTSGTDYRQLLPLIKRLDVMPKQVVLEVMIAEVKLTDVFKQGVELALTNRGSAAVTGGFNLESKAAGFSYLLSGFDGSFALNLLQTNDHVNVLSRPTLSVRDGVSASITVGDDIPTVGEVISDINGNRSSVVYRKTGIDLQVRPTVNAQGVVLMEISQKISNQTKGAASVAGSPVIFERGITTEVVAESGQTIMLGGLISENRTINDRSVPFFSSIPLFGRLFDATDDSGDKTELVIMVTPRIIESADEWHNVIGQFESNMSGLQLNNIIK